MAWTPTRTWTAEEDFTKTYADAYLRDNLDELDAHGAVTRTNKSAGAVAAGSVVCQTTVAGEVATTTSANDTRAVLVSSDSIAVDATGRFYAVGIRTVLVQGTVAINDRLATSTTAGRAQASATAAFGIALTANASGAGSVLALLDRSASASAVTFATPAIVLGTAAAAGAAGTVIRSDATIVAFDATVPTTSAVGDAAAVGAAAVAARRNHVHGREGFGSPSALTVGGSGSDGSATTIPHADHVHAITALGLSNLPAIPTLFAYASALQSLTNNVDNYLNLDTETIDTDAAHFPSAANLTGTVSKTNGSTLVTGSGTAFTAELSVGQVIDVPGTATEERVVTQINSDTSLNVATTFANTASGQTATRVNSAAVCRVAGKYFLAAAANFATNATGIRSISIWLNGATIQAKIVAPSGSITTCDCFTVATLAQWDILRVSGFQNSGGALNTVATYAGMNSLLMHRLTA